MEARASFDSPSPTRVLIVLMVAIAAALLVGGIGGYIVRGLTYSVSNTTTTDTHRPFVVEPVPYSSPAALPSAQPTRDPKGFEVPV
jgi:hypothetical protein